MANLVRNRIPIFLVLLCLCGASPAVGQLASPSGSYYVAFRRADDQIQTGFSPDGGAVWPSSSRFIHTDNPILQGPGIAAHPSANRVMLAFFTQTLNGDTKLVVKQGAGPTNWIAEPPAEAAFNTSTRSAPAISHHFNNQYVVAWNTGEGRMGAVRTACFVDGVVGTHFRGFYSRDSNGNLVADTSLVPGATSVVGAPAAASNGERALVVWRQQSDNLVLLDGLRISRGQRPDNPQDPQCLVFGDADPLALLTNDLPLLSDRVKFIGSPALTWNGSRFLLTVIVELLPSSPLLGSLHVLTFTSQDGIAWSQSRHCFLETSDRISNIDLAASPTRTLLMISPRTSPASDGRLTLDSSSGPCPGANTGELTRTWSSMFGDSGDADNRAAVAFVPGGGAGTCSVHTAILRFPDRRIQTNVSPDGGRNWPENLRFVHQELSSLGPAIGSHPTNGDLVLAFFHDGRLFVKRGTQPSLTAAVNWGPLSAGFPAVSQTAPTVTHIADDVYAIAWNTGPGISTATFNASTGTIDPPATPLVPGIQSSDIMGPPSIVSDADGGILLVWRSPSLHVDEHIRFAIGRLNGTVIEWLENGAAPLATPGLDFFLRPEVFPAVACDGSRFFLSLFAHHIVNNNLIHRVVVFSSQDGRSWTPVNDCIVEPNQIRQKLSLAIRGGNSILFAAPLRSNALFQGYFRHSLLSGCPNQATQHWQIALENLGMGNQRGSLTVVCETGRRENGTSLLTRLIDIQVLHKPFVGIIKLSKEAREDTSIRLDVDRVDLITVPEKVVIPKGKRSVSFKVEVRRIPSTETADVHIKAALRTDSRVATVHLGK